MSVPVTAEHARGQAATRAWLLPAVFAWLAATAWLRPLALPDEGRYVGVALEMLWSGDWLVPTLDTLPYFHKPPLFYWLTAASLGVFGINEWAARLPSLLAATGAAFAVYLFVRRWAGERQAHLALAVLATTPFFFGGAQFANLDMLVAACIACTILCAADAVLAAEATGRAAARLSAAYAFAALGILAKGLIGVAIPALVIGAWLVATGADGHCPAPRVAAGLALFAAIAVPWFALMEARHPGFLDYSSSTITSSATRRRGFNNPPALLVRSASVFAGSDDALVLLALTDAVRRPAEGEDVQRQVHALMWSLARRSRWCSLSSRLSKLVGYVLVAVPPFGDPGRRLALRASSRGRAEEQREGGHGGPRRLAVRGGACRPGASSISARHNIQPLAARIRPLLTSA